MFLKWTLPSLNLDISTIANRDFCQNSKIEVANSVDPDEMALFDPEPSRQDLHVCTSICFWSSGMNWLPVMPYDVPPTVLSTAFGKTFFIWRFILNGQNDL